MQPKQLEFDELMFDALNENAMPKKRSIEKEIIRNERKIATSRNSSIRYMLGMYERQVYLLKELQRIRND